MSKFIPRWNTAKPTIKLMDNHCPYLLISQVAIAKMRLYVEECTDEIGWLGSISEVADDRMCYIMDDVYLFDQEVHSTTTEISPQGLADFATKILQEEGGYELWNRMCAWGHSHVNMGVSPSGQDDSQMKTFEDGGHDYFFRLICNKKGDIKVDMYDYQSGVIYTDIPWDVEATNEDYDIKKQIIQLQKLLDNRESTMIADMKDSITAEMKTKVKKKWGNYNYKSNYDSDKVSYFEDPKIPTGAIPGWKGGKKGYWIGVTFYAYEKQPQQNKSIGFIDDKKKVTKSNEKKNEEQISFFANQSDLVFTNFNGSELVYMAKLSDSELEEHLFHAGWDYLTKEDIALIKSVAKKVKDTYEKEFSHESAKLKFNAPKNFFTSINDVFLELGLNFLASAQGESDEWLMEEIIREGYDDYFTVEDFNTLKEAIALYGEELRQREASTNSTR